jgi:hypothetical protein
MKSSKMELIELIKKIDDEKILKNLKFYVSGYILNKKK